tara:strand:+ start:698 stop:1159 length:462 start_codon:yes stop_codon:yes gene_type:complete
MKSVGILVLMFAPLFLLAHLAGELTGGPVNVLVISKDTAHHAAKAPNDWNVHVVNSNEELLLVLKSINRNARIAVAVHGDSKGLEIKGSKKWLWDSYSEALSRMGRTVYQVSCLGKGKSSDWDGRITQVGNVKYLGTKGKILWFGLENLNDLP